MRYLVDGHNLIPRVAGLSLEMLDDEQQLVERLQAFCRQGRHQVEVYFDGAPAGDAGRRRHGNVTAVYVRRGQIADDAIRGRLRQLGASARQWTVVSSDQAVQVAGREVHAEVLGADEFARRLAPGAAAESAAAAGVAAGEKPGGELLDEGEVEEWLRFFGVNKK